MNDRASRECQRRREEVAGRFNALSEDLKTRISSLAHSITVFKNLTQQRKQAKKDDRRKEAGHLEQVMPNARVMASRGVILVSVVPLPSII